MLLLFIFNCYFNRFDSFISFLLFKDTFLLLSYGSVLFVCIFGLVLYRFGPLIDIHIW